jgi:heat shock protein HtpX
MKTIDVRRASAINLVKAWLLVSIPTATAGAAGWWILGVRGISLFVACSLLGWLGMYSYGDRTLLGMLGARPFAIAASPLLRSTVDRLAAGMGVAPPRLYVIDDLFPRAFSVGRGPRAAAIAVSEGLLADLPPDELEGILGHELAHIRRRDVLPQTFAVLIAQMLVEVSRIGGWFARPLLYVLGPVGAAFVHLTLSPRRETEADALAARVGGSPDAVADALVRLDRAADLVAFSAPPATAPLYPLDLFDDSRLPRLFKTHPPLEARVAHLRTLTP